MEEAVAKTGYNHRQFIRLFSGAVGLTPKVYSRVQRFQKALTSCQFCSRQRRSGALDSRVQGARLPLFDPFDI
ncbi:hypothetical protein LP416_20630 [Polaromonas sp. P2-4]|nr:hypothetical protein LP416_20630 [Polaromonas sp. P2-4]